MRAKFFKKDELKHLWPFYTDATFLSIFYIIAPFQILYLLSLEFNLFQIGLLTSAQLLAAFIFEIPTGAVADIFGRKVSVLIGTFLSAITVMLIYFFTDFYILFILFFIWGFAQTFISGAYDAWAIDKLKQKKKNNLVQEYFSKGYSFFNFSGLLSGLVGALLVKQFGLGIIWPVTGIHLLIVGAIFLFISEEHKKKKAKFKEHIIDFKKHTKSSIKYSFTHKNLKLFMIAMAFLAVFGLFVGNITWYPFLQEVGFQDHWFGYLFSLSMVLGIFTPHYVKRLIKKSKGYRNYLLIVLSTMLLLLIILIPIKSLILVIIMFIIFNAMWDFFLPAMRPFFQSFIPSKMRATISSLDAQIYSLLGIFATPMIGFIADKIGPHYAISMGIVFLLPIIYLYSKLKDNKN